MFVLNNGYILNDGVRIFKNGNLEVRLRTGVWNYEEAVINLLDEEEEVQKTVLDIIEKMEKGIAVSEEDINKYSLTGKNKESILELVSGLNYGGFIIDENEGKTERVLNSILLGRNYNIPRDIELKQSNKVVLLTDNEVIKEYTINLSEKMDFNIEVVEDDNLKKLRQADITTKTDALKVQKLYTNFKYIFGKYDIFVVIMKYLDVKTLRNLNCLLVEWNKPAVISFLDGPFINLMVTKGEKTGCFECFEQRALARIEDTSAYHTFVNTESNHIKKESKGYYPVLNMITNMAIMEAYQLTFVGSSKLCGRILGVYLPNLEIQVQDLLRVPYCNQCGTLSKAQFEEINVSSKRLINEIISKAR